jgi:biopolymer transport protein ExbD
MSVVAPGRRPAYPPIGRLRTSPLSGGGKKNMFVSLNLTPMVDMFTILVIFLIQLFKATGQVELKPDITVPQSKTGPALQDQSTICVVYPDGTMVVDTTTIPADQMGDALQTEIPGLVDVLTKKKEFASKLDAAMGKTEDPTKPFDKALLVQADVKADFKVVRRIIYSANLAGWAKFKFITTPVGGKPPPADPAAGGDQPAQ